MLIGTMPGNGSRRYRWPDLCASEWAHEQQGDNCCARYIDESGCTKESCGARISPSRYQNAKEASTEERSRREKKRNDRVAAQDNRRDTVEIELVRLKKSSSGPLNN